MTGKVSLHGFVDTHRVSGTMGGGGIMGRERDRQAGATSTTREPRQ